MRDVFEFPKEGQGQEEWGVPPVIKNLPECFLEAYIRAIFDTEGDIAPASSKSPYIGVS